MTVLLPLSMEIKICTHPVNPLSAKGKRFLVSDQLYVFLCSRSALQTGCFVASQRTPRVKAEESHLFVAADIKTPEGLKLTNTLYFPRTDVQTVHITFCLYWHLLLCCDFVTNRL